MIISIKEECRRYLITGKEGSYAKGGHPTLYTCGAKIRGHLYTGRDSDPCIVGGLCIAGPMQRRGRVGGGRRLQCMYNYTCGAGVHVRGHLHVHILKEGEGWDYAQGGAIHRGGLCIRGLYG